MIYMLSIALLDETVSREDHGWTIGVCALLLPCVTVRHDKSERRVYKIIRVKLNIKFFIVLLAILCRV